MLEPTITIASITGLAATAFDGGRRAKPVPISLWAVTHAWLERPASPHVRAAIRADMEEADRRG
jgi:hypothetical protein